MLSTLLTSMIQSGQIRPGDRLPAERELARQFNMGRLVVREGMRTLQSQGIVSVKRGCQGGYYVEDLNPRRLSQHLTSALSFARISLNDLLEARLGVEGEIIRLVTNRAKPEDLRRLRANVEDTKRLLAAGASTELRKMVHEFHILLAEAAQNPLYTVIMHSIVSKKTVIEHEAIVESLEQQSFATAEHLLRDHIIKDEQRLKRRAEKQVKRR